MQRKKMTLRFDLDHPEDRQAWEYLQGLNAVSLNRTLVSIINQAAHISLMKDDFHYFQEAYNLVGKEAGENTAQYVAVSGADM